MEEDFYELIQKIKPSFCDNKIETISNYKFTVCFENTQYEGYVTEKMIDCFIAGTIPVYLGAPDVEEFVPKDCFIQYDEFNSLEELEKYLKESNERQLRYATGIQIIINQIERECQEHKGHNVGKKGCIARLKRLQENMHTL